jgi:hypothetical protein
MFTAPKYSPEGLQIKENMHHIYICALEVEVVKRNLGMSVRDKLGQAGQLVLVTLWVTGTLNTGQLRIYKECISLVVDISPNISAKVTVACPQRWLRQQLPGSKPNGAVWLEYLALQSVFTLSESPGKEILETWRYVSSDEWVHLLRQDLLSGTRNALSISPMAAVRELNREFGSVQDVYRPLVMNPVLRGLNNSLSEMQEIYQ